jgi:hypothetical protein
MLMCGVELANGRPLLGRWDQNSPQVPAGRFDDAANSATNQAHESEPQDGWRALCHAH